eukprot:UN08179
MTDELLCKAQISKCQNFQHTSQIVAKVAFKMFLGVDCEVVSMGENKKSFVLRLNSNPLKDFVEIPKEYKS